MKVPHTDTEAPVAREGPTEAMVHQAEFKMCCAWLGHLSVNFHRHRLGKVWPGRPQAMAGCQLGPRAVGDHHRLGLELQGLPPWPQGPQLPAIALALQALHGHAWLKAGPSGAGLLHQKGIEHGSAHDPEGGIAG